MLKVVIDTNIIASAFISPNGLPAQIITAWRQGLFDLITSPQIIDEVAKVLTSEKIQAFAAIPPETIEALLVELKGVNGFIVPKISFTFIKEDPDDDKFLIAGIAGKANLIISGDKHLKNLKSYQDIKILSPADFVKVLSAFHS